MGAYLGDYLQYVPHLSRNFPRFGMVVEDEPSELSCLVSVKCCPFDCVVHVSKMMTVIVKEKLYCFCD